MHIGSLKYLFFSFLIIVFVGAILLMLPFSHNGEIRFIDALFTSTSATCVTGLIVKDTANDFTIIGQIIILSLIQIGGLGYMTIATFLAVLLGRKLNVSDKMLLKNSLDYPTISGLIIFLKQVIKFVLLIELIGAIFLSIRFSFDMDMQKAIWFGIFHSISAFNNAGFSLFSDNLMRYYDDFLINFVICALIILGGVGFYVLTEASLRFKNARYKLSAHTKITLIGYIVVILGGMALLLMFEWNNEKILIDKTVYEKILISYFASVNYRTAGFNTIDLSALSDVMLYISSMIMLIGGGAGGTAGGIKVSTIAILLVFAYYSLRGEEKVYIFKRSIPADTINKSFSLFVVASFYVLITSMSLAALESAPFLNILFEVCSGFATVGLSTGNGGVLSLSANFSDIGKILIMTIMYIGRIGVFAFTVVLMGNYIKSRIVYPEGRFLL